MNGTKMLSTSLGAASGVQRKVTNVTVRLVANGFIVESYCTEPQIAITIDEALALVRREFDL